MRSRDKQIAMDQLSSCIHGTSLFGLNQTTNNMHLSQAQSTTQSIDRPAKALDATSKWPREKRQTATNFDNKWPKTKNNNNNNARQSTNCCCCCCNWRKDLATIVDVDVYVLVDVEMVILQIGLLLLEQAK